MIKDIHHFLNNFRLVLFITVLLWFSSGNSANAQSLVGVWENTEEDLTLTLRTDNSGELKLGTKVFPFVSDYSLVSVGSNQFLNFTIQVRSEHTDCFAIVEQKSSTTIKYISFLSNELRNAATTEVIQSGITLTKQQ